MQRARKSAVRMHILTWVICAELAKNTAAKYRVQTASCVFSIHRQKKVAATTQARAASREMIGRKNGAVVSVAACTGVVKKSSAYVPDAQYFIQREFHC